MATKSAPLASNVNRLASKWTAAHPELRGRMERAIALVANVTPGRMSHVFFVEGSEGAKYIVRVNRRERSSSCTCPDHENRGGRCKHILAAALWEKGQA